MPETDTFYSYIIVLSKVDGLKQTLLDANIKSKYRTVKWVDWNDDSWYLNKKTINVNFSSKEYQKCFNKSEIWKASWTIKAF